jgi:hypothetical protein
MRNGLKLDLLILAVALTAAAWISHEQSDAAILALGLTLVPIAAGLSAGLLLRRGAEWARLLAIGLPLCALPGLCRVLPISFWDLAWIVGGWLLGMALGRPGVRPQGLVLAGFTALAGGAGVEAAARHLLPPQTRMASLLPPGDPVLTYEAPGREHPACYAFDTTRFPPWPEHRRGGVIRPGPRIVHLGDSMVFGTGVQSEEAFTADLERLDPGFAHINFGIPGSSTDAQFVALNTWLERIKPSRVVLHFFVANDIDELDRGYACTNGEPFVRYDSMAAPRYAAPVWGFNAAMAVAEAPPPYALRVLSPSSAAVRWGLRGFAALGQSLSRLFDHEPPEAVRWAHLDLILRTLKNDLDRRGIPLAVSVLPSRTILAAQYPESEPDWQIRLNVLTLLHRLGIPAGDPWSYLRDIVERKGVEAILLPGGDFHFNPEGHRRYAEWLLRTYGTGLRDFPGTAVAQATSGRVVKTREGSGHELRP